MTVTGDEPHPIDSPGPGPQFLERRRDASSAVHGACPFLRTESGTGRAAHASRDHRCGAVDPPAPLAVAKQRTLCLVPAHETCATYLAARALAEAAAPSPPTDDDARLWPATRSAPVLMEPVRGLLAPIAGDSARAGGQAVLVGLMVIALLVLVVSRIQPSPGPGDASPDASGGLAGAATPATPVATPAASPSDVTGPSGSLSPSPSPVESASPAATASPSPTATPRATPKATPKATPGVVRYTVRAGDTLSGIAARFGTTVKALKVANDIADARLIRVGQVLVIP